MSVLPARHPALPASWQPPNAPIASTASSLGIKPSHVCLALRIARPASMLKVVTLAWILTMLRITPASCVVRSTMAVFLASLRDAMYVQMLITGC